MASRWKLQYSVNITPIEEIELEGYHVNDAPNELSRNIHSLIDKTIGGSQEYETSTDAPSNIKYVPPALAITQGVTYESIEVSKYFNENIGGICTFLYIKIAKLFPALSPDVVISLDGGSTGHLRLIGLGDQTLLRFGTAVDPADIMIKSTLVSNLCYVEMIMGVN